MKTFTWITVALLVTRSIVCLGNDPARINWNNRQAASSLSKFILAQPQQPLTNILTWLAQTETKTNLTTAGTYQALPGRIEAESYDAMKGIQTESTADAGGGKDVGWIDDWDWMDYNVNVAQAGTYTFNFRVANGYGSGRIEIRTADGTVLSALDVPQTGGWQVWKTISTTATLPAGNQTLRIFALRGLWNFNWLEAVSTATPATSTAGSKSVPGRIEAESYDTMNGVQTETTGDASGSLDVGWIDDNDWMEYNVNVATAGTYTFSFRVASTVGSGRIELRNTAGTALGSLKVSNTGGWQTWTNVSMTATLNAGIQTLRVYAMKGGWNFNWIDISAAGTVAPSVPTTSAPVAAFKPVPGQIEAEAYDLMSGVKTETTGDASGSLDVGWIDDNDWMDYKVNVASDGTYTFNFRVANGYGNGRIEIRTSGGTVLSALDIPQTGGWQVWKTISTTANLSAGNQTLRIFAVRGLWNFNWMNISKWSPTIQSVISFSALPDQPVSSTAYTLNATSNNTTTPITFTSSNPAIVSVSNATGTWKATSVAAGTATITASQAASDTYLAAADVSVSQVVLPATSLTTDKKIPIDGSRWYQLNNVTNGLEGLFDGVTNAEVQTGFGKILTNFDAYYPLADGESMTIQSIRLFSGNGTTASSPLTISIINDQWQRIPIATYYGGKYNNWFGPDPNRQASGDAQYKLDTPISNARYIVINAYYTYPNEIELYGTYTAGKQPTAAPAKSIQLKNMFGVNAFEWNFEHPSKPIVIDEDRWKAAKNFTGFRHYMDWQKLESSEGSYTFNPSHSGGWNYDAIYTRCKAEGMAVLACLKTLPDWMINTYPDSDKDSENTPVRYGKDFTDPKSYFEQARIAFQYVARYGRNKNVDRSLLSVNTTSRWTNDPVNTVQIGMDLINYIECDNERDKWWKGRKAYQTGREYAANMSAFYDGHKNTMGAGIGVKNADPTMVVVMGGLALSTMGTDYVKGMIDWCKQYRGYKPNGQVDLCWDVINYHLYPDDNNSSQSGVATRGKAPEISVVPAVAQKFLKLAHDAAYDMPVWVSETGYDVNQGSPLKAIAIGNKSASQTQADWTLRMALLYARLGIDKVFFYQMYSDDPTSQGQFGSSGLINEDRTPTLAARFMSQTNKLLGEYNYKETLNSDPVVDRYELNGKSAYSLVVPDEVGRTATYTLTLSNGVKWAKIYTPTANSDTLSVQQVAVNNGTLTLPVTETPIFVVPSTSANGRVAAEPETTGEANAPLASLLIYPNPAVDEVTLSLTNASLDNVEVNIYDAGLGRLQQQLSLPKTAESISAKVRIQDLPGGLYIFEIKHGVNRTYRKIIKVQ